MVILFLASSLMTTTSFANIEKLHSEIDQKNIEQTKTDKGLDQQLFNAANLEQWLNEAYIGSTETEFFAREDENFRRHGGNNPGPRVDRPRNHGGGYPRIHRPGRNGHYGDHRNWGRWLYDHWPWGLTRPNYPVEVICYAEGYSGQTYSAFGFSSIDAQETALDRCYDFEDDCVKSGCTMTY